MTKEEFEKLVIEGIKKLPEDVKIKIKNVAFLIEDEARSRKLKEHNIMHGHTLLGLYEGIPRTRRGEGYTSVLPDRITIFKEPIEHISGYEPKKVEELIYEVLWHEVGHYFGFGEEAIRRLEKKRFKKN